jgi:hypothetical protein
MQFTAKALKVLVCVALGLAWSGPALAWDDRGHMTVAYIAYKQLTPATRDRVNVLLKLNPKYSDWPSCEWSWRELDWRICPHGKNTTRTLERAADA